MRFVMITVALLLAGCSREDMRQTREDGRKVGADLRKDLKNADAVVTKEAKELREKAKEGAGKVKRDMQNDR